jgi:hypothetical protein
MRNPQRPAVSWTIRQTALACALAAIGCAQPLTRIGDADPATDDTTTADAGACEIVLTPGGPVGKSCVHEVPSGAAVDINDAGVTTVSLNGQVIATYPPCTCPRTNSGIPGAGPVSAGGANH